MTSGLVLLAGAGVSQAEDNGAGNNEGDHKVLVCKYVGKPGVDERLKAENPISVDSSATVGTWFNDAQGRSYVLAVDDGSSTYSVADCPKPDPDEVDVCPNIDGDQAKVPDGMVKNADGHCVKKDDDVVDVCPNIDGDQAKVPDGKMKDADGDCVNKPDEEPTNAHCPPGGSPPGDVDGLPNEEDGETDRTDHCVEAVNPVVNQSEECDEEGSFRIRSTRGVLYFLDGKEIAAGVYPGPITGTVTAKPSGPTFELSNPNFSFEVDIPPAEVCATATPSVTPTVTETPSVTPTVTDTATVTPSETATTRTPEVEGTDAVPPTDEGPSEAVPTAVDAGLPGGPAAASSTDLLAKVLVGGGLALMMAAGWLQMGRQNRGAHQV